MPRKSPADSATAYPEGTIRQGLDTHPWVVKKGRCVPYATTELHGFRVLTVDYLAKHIGKFIPIYEREYSDTWPISTRGLTSAIFVPSGDAGYLGKQQVLHNWLRTQDPPIKDHTVFLMDGILNGLQVDSMNKRIVSSNIMNTETFVRA